MEETTGVEKEDGWRVWERGVWIKYKNILKIIKPLKRFSTPKICIYFEVKGDVNYLLITYSSVAGIEPEDFTLLNQPLRPAACNYVVDISGRD